MPASGSVDVLVRFSRLASEAGTGAEILPLLADAAIDHVKADAAAVVELTGAGEARVAASREVPEALSQWRGEADDLDSELGSEFLRLSGGRFARVRSILLVSTGGLFGTLVLFFAGDRELEEHNLSIAHGLADLAAIAMGRAVQIAQLAKANAELRASREVLARTEKLRALGQMAAGLSHDLKNILNPLSMHTQIAKRALAKGNATQANASLDEMGAVIRRGVETIDRLRTFSRQAPESRAQQVDLNALTHEACALARPRMSSKAAALSRIVEERGEVSPVVGHPEEIVAAVLNLVVNAIDAMPGGGNITVRTVQKDDSACVIVADDGPGMPAEVQARVFEPFFTTKGAEGTGLGLANVFATMQRHGGSVLLETVEGKGASFTLCFPAAPQTA
jgi:signal transduction histidine kinase